MASTPDQPMDMDVWAESARPLDRGARAIASGSAPGPAGAGGPGAGAGAGPLGGKPRGATGGEFPRGASAAEGGAAAFDVDGATALEVEDAGEGEGAGGDAGPDESLVVAAQGVPFAESVPRLPFGSSAWRPAPSSGAERLLSPMHPLVRVPGVASPPEGFDLSAYLSRIGLSRREADEAVSRLAGSPELVCSLMRRHLSQIPFEAMDPLTGRAIDVSPRGIHAKVVAGGRGGWCFEQNALMAWALRGLGYRVDRLLGRVLVGDGGADGEHPRTHAVSLVHFEELEGEGGEEQDGDERMRDEEGGAGALALGSPPSLRSTGVLDSLAGPGLGERLELSAARGREGAVREYAADEALGTAPDALPDAFSSSVLGNAPDALPDAFSSSVLGNAPDAFSSSRSGALGALGSHPPAALPSTACLPSPHLALKGPLAEPFLVDVGFGGRGSTWPLPVARKGIFKTAHGTFRIRDPEEAGAEAGDGGARGADEHGAAARADPGKRSLPGASAPASKRARHVVDLEREGLAGVLRLPLRAPTRGPLVVEKLVEDDEGTGGEDETPLPSSPAATIPADATRPGGGKGDAAMTGNGSIGPMPSGAAPFGGAQTGDGSIGSTPSGAAPFGAAQTGNGLAGAAPLAGAPGLPGSSLPATPRKPRGGKAPLWERQYELYLDPQRDSDFHTGNWYVSTHDSSVFKHRLFVSKVTDGERRILFDGGLTVEPSRQARERGMRTKRKWLDDPQDIEHELRDGFNLPVQDAWKGAIRQVAKRAKEKKEAGETPSGE